MNYECERCGGWGGSQMDDGYMPCFNCGDTGRQEQKPSWMVQGPFCRGIVTTPSYRQGWWMTRKKLTAGFGNYND